MPLGPQLVTYGNVQSTFLLTVSLTFTSTAAGALEQNITVPGLLVGDQISDLSLTTAFPNTILSIANARVSAANTLTVAIVNPTGGTLTYPAGVYYIEVNRVPSGLAMSGIQ